MGSLGFTKVEKLSTISPSVILTAPISIILFSVAENPVVSISNTTKVSLIVETPSTIRVANPDIQIDENLLNKYFCMNFNGGAKVIEVNVRILTIDGTIDTTDDDGLYECNYVGMTRPDTPNINDVVLESDGT